MNVGVYKWNLKMIIFDDKHVILVHYYKMIYKQELIKI